MCAMFDGKLWTLANVWGRRPQGNSRQWGCGSAAMFDVSPRQAYSRVLFASKYGIHGVKSKQCYGQAGRRKGQHGDKKRVQYTDPGVVRRFVLRGGGGSSSHPVSWPPGEGDPPAAASEPPSYARRALPPEGRRWWVWRSEELLLLRWRGR
jgi:hypothetical protein